MQQNNNKTKAGKIFLSIILIILTLGAISVGGYFAYKFLNSSINQKINNIGSDYYEESNDSSGAFKFFYDKDNNLIFNAKKTEKSGEIKSSFKYGNLTIMEKPVYTDGNKKYYYLGEKGIQLLNTMFKKRALYGPEINALKSIKIGFPSKDNKNNSANGLYYPSLREIYIFTDGPLNNNLKLLNQPVAKRVEIIFGTIMHEYTHHIDNMYNKSIKETDEFSDNTLIEDNGDGHEHGGNSHIIKKRQINNKKFLKEFRFNLNYHDIPLAQKSKYIRRESDFEYIKGKIPVYKDFSSNDLFRFVNLDISEFEKENYNKMFDNKHYFNNNKNQEINFANPIESKSLKYLFSFAELIPRELVKLSLGPNSTFYVDKNYKSLENFLYFAKERNDLFGNIEVIFSSTGDDILKTISKAKHKTTWKDIWAYAPNWVFRKQIEEFVSNKWDNDNFEYEKPFKNVGDTRHKGLFKAYVDLMGWGQLISFAHYNINNDSGNSLNFGGYFQLPKNNTEYQNKKMKLLLVSKDNNKKIIESNITLQKYNLITKKEWDSKYESSLPEGQQKNYWTEKWIYPELFKENFYYVSYIARNINKPNFNKIIGNNAFDIKLWIDLNNDGKYDLEDINQKEVFSLLNDDKFNNKGKNFFDKYVNDQRKTTTYKMYSYRDSLAEWFELKKDTNNKYYYYLKPY
ncbi:hypothetical protein DMC14_002700 [Metamycoplasma phocicerebrale]|uniref:Uncharacterized protein n=1 Tax=Metamycoplasma phocicerebrale TaxID=142649 RepID=A0A3T0TUF2_9BACT|nr:hypothetical protein [Metamycoplasma phocicerebrale]AZZ65678.1 hypothetical protein DMC14_002700 [Metamycoplasma phocicerebrale]